MKILFQEDSDFEEFKNELKKCLKKRQIRNIQDSGYKRAAVNILLMNKNNSVHILLTKRSENVSTHKGQISFPGGVYDEEDREILNTVFRETYEEVGIPFEKIKHIGRFDDYISVYGHHVTCFVGAIEYPFEYNFNEDEIDDYIEAPLSIFINLEYDRIEKYNFKGRDFNVYHYLFEGHDIWGLTARILTDFAQQVCKDLS